MALASYTDLQTQVGNWLARSDLAPFVPDFITLFECAAARKLKVRLQEATVTLTPTSGAATLPSDYLGYRRVTYTGSPNHELDYVAPPTWSSLYPADGAAGTAISFTIEGNNLRVGPSDNAALTFDYFQKTPAVSGALNWLYTNHPDAYLFGALCEANAFMKNPTNAALWKARRDEVFQEIAMLDFNERQGMSVRVMSVTP
jgi:hypothetical protein